MNRTDTGAFSVKSSIVHGGRLLECGTFNEQNAGKRGGGKGGFNRIITWMIARIHSTKNNSMLYQP